MHFIILLATMNLYIHRKNKIQRQQFEDKSFEILTKSIFLETIDGDLNEQATQERTVI